MAYMVVSSRTGKQEEVQGPTYFGDIDTDRKWVDKLQGFPLDPPSDDEDSDHSKNSLEADLGLAYKTYLSPRMVLTRLDELGFKFLTFGMGSQSAIWTLKAAVKKETTKKAATNRAKKSLAVDEVETEVVAGNGKTGGKGKAVVKTKTPVAKLQVKKEAAAKEKVKEQPMDEESGTGSETGSDDELDDESEQDAQPLSSKSTKSGATKAAGGKQ